MPLPLAPARSTGAVLALFGALQPARLQTVS